MLQFSYILTLLACCLFTPGLSFVAQNPNGDLISDAHLAALSVTANDISATSVSTDELVVKGVTLFPAQDRVLVFNDTSIDIGVQLNEAFATYPSPIIVRLVCSTEWFWRQRVLVPDHTLFHMGSSCQDKTDESKALITLLTETSSEKQYITKLRSGMYSHIHMYRLTFLDAMEDYTYYVSSVGNEGVVQLNGQTSMTYNRVRFYGIWPFFNLRYAGNVLELAFCHFAPKVDGNNFGLINQRNGWTEGYGYGQVILSYNFKPTNVDRVGWTATSTALGSFNTETRLFTDTTAVTFTAQAQYISKH